MKLKKYPLLLCIIISFVLIAFSAVVIGIFGVNVGSSLGGGSQMEIVIENDADVQNYVSATKAALSRNNVGLDTCFVEDKIIAGNDDATFTTKVLVVKMTNSNLPDEKKQKITQEISENLHIDASNVSEIQNIYSSISSSNLLKVGLAVGIIVVCMFAFGFIRYSVFAGISFVISILHNLILYFSLIILSRTQFNLTNLTIALIVTLILLIVMIRMFERHKQLADLHLSDKLKESQRLIKAENETVSPYLIVAIVALVAAVLLVIVSAPVVRFIAASIAISVVVSVYTLLLVGPGVYAYFLDLREYHASARLSRNSEVNKNIKKKTTKAQNKTK